MDKKLNRKIRDVEYEYTTVLRNVKEWRSRAMANSTEDNVHQLALYLGWKQSLAKELITLYWKALGLNER